MNVDMSCGGAKNSALPQVSHYGYEEVSKVGGSPRHGGNQEEALLPGTASLQEVSCPQCRRLLRVVYPTIALMVLCFGLILGMGLLQYMQYKDNLELSQRLETFCPAPGGQAGAAQHPDTTGPPGSPGQVGQVGKPPRGAGVPGGPWERMPPAASNDEEEEEEDMDEEQEHRGKRSATGESGGRAARAGRHTRHNNRHKRCISCPTNMVNHVHAASSGNLLSGAYADVRSSSDMFRNWKLADWSSGVKNKFNGTTGLLTIEDPGLYWLYAQVMFYNSVFDNGFSIKIFRHSETAPSEEGEHLAMCMHTTDYNNPDTPEYNDKYRTCNVGIPALLGKGDRIGIASLYEGRMVVFSSTSSYWGIIKQSPPPPSP